jgi:cellobiose phosphorylase
LYRVGLEAILGIRRQGRFLSIEPSIPSHWPRYELSIRHGSATYRIHVDNTSGIGRGVGALILDGERVGGTQVPLSDDGRSHDLDVIIGSP